MKDTQYISAVRELVSRLKRTGMRNDETVNWLFEARITTISASDLTPEKKQAAIFAAADVIENEYVPVAPNFVWSTRAELNEGGA